MHRRYVEPKDRQFHSIFVGYLGAEEKFVAKGFVKTCTRKGNASQVEERCCLEFEDDDVDVVLNKVGEFATVPESLRTQLIDDAEPIYF